MKTRLAFLWHMHQPLYVDPASGELVMPWVRLHATRAYFDMAWMLERHPAVRCTVNFTPVLMEQLEAYALGTARDRFLEVSRRRPADLDAAGRQAVLRSFFMNDWETSVKPLPRYHELLEKRGRDVRYVDLARVARDFSDAELGDLQVLFNLAWFGFGALAEDEGLRALRQKGRAFTAADQAYVLEAQERVLAEVVPRWRALAARGQVELSTTPYFHPILPLVCDSDSAARALPHTPLPPRYAWPDDARWQVREALASHLRHFATPALGMWPAEGSVSPEALEVLAGEGVRWAATDEAVLLRSLPGDPPRLRSLYRPWRGGGRQRRACAMLFRDRGLSDLIGFSYAPLARRGGRRRLHLAPGAPSATPGSATARPGRPPWASSSTGRTPGSTSRPRASDFLEALYRRLEAAPGLATATLSEATEEAGAGRAWRRIHSGSWIEGSFRIWMGHDEDRRAWAALGRAREAAGARARRAAPPGSRRRRWRGRPASSSPPRAPTGTGGTATTSTASRSPSSTRSSAASSPPPASSCGRRCRWRCWSPSSARGRRPARAARCASPATSSPPPSTGARPPSSSGRGPGLHRPAKAQGSMFGGATDLLGALLYGFDLERLYLRLDPAESPQRSGEACSAVRVSSSPGAVRSRWSFPARPGRRVRPGARGEQALGQVAFPACSSSSSPSPPSASPPASARAVGARAAGRRGAGAAAPLGGYVTLSVPDQDFERIHWRV